MSEEPARPTAFLLGVDLEPLPLSDPLDRAGWDDLEALTRVVLACLARHGWRATFFTVGQVVEQRPGLVAEIVAGGHEIACHSHAHDRVGRLTPDAFRRDLDRNLKALRDAGAQSVIGFRAPFFSLTEAVADWAYAALRASGIRYSSSVSAFRNFGRGFSDRAPAVAARHGIVELPVTPLVSGPVGVPLGGLYWRLCPRPLLLRSVRRRAARAPFVASFFHPHDFTAPGARYLGPATFLKSPLLAPILAFGRRSVEAKLDEIPNAALSVLPFQEYLQREGLLRDRDEAEYLPVASGRHRH